MKYKGRKDPNKIELITNLKRAAAANKSHIWNFLASEMSKSNRNRITVNLSRINRVTSPGEKVLVPGKVLGGGSLKHNLDIAAESFSISAQEKIKNAGGLCLSIQELMKQNPSGSNIRIIK